MQKRLLCGAFLCILIIVMIMCAYALHTANRASAFFSKRLAEAGATERVIISGRPFEVTRGIVAADDEKPLGIRTRLQVLKIAYAQELARRSPLLGISGTDPDKLRRNVQSLAQAADDLAALQTKASDAELVRSSLYPLSFLSSLAALETDRQAFLSSGTDSDEVRYEAMLAETTAAGARDATAFQKGFAAATADAPLQSLSTFGGTITPANSSSSIATLSVRFDELKNRLGHHVACLRYHVRDCDPQALVLPELPQLSAMNTQGDADAGEVRDLIAAASSPSFLTEHIEVVLASSTCVSMMPPPYHFLAKQPGYTGLFTPDKFINDLFFAPTSQVDSPVPTYLRSTYDISLLLSNPMQFYQCPQIGNDMGLMRAIIATATFAREHPQYANAQRDRLLSSHGILYESDARAYMRAMLSAESWNAISSGDRDELISIYLMFTEGSANLEYIIGMIAQTDAGDALIRAGGAPFDVSARTLFLTHSAFPTLFLTQNLSAGGIAIRLTEFNQTNFQKLLAQYVTYRSIRSTVPKEKIVRDIRSLYDFEDNID